MCWADVNMEEDRRRLDIDEGATEEQRKLVKSEAEKIAHGTSGNLLTIKSNRANIQSLHLAWTFVLARSFKLRGA